MEHLLDFPGSHNALVELTALSTGKIMIWMTEIMRWAKM